MDTGDKIDWSGPGCDAAPESMERNVNHPRRYTKGKVECIDALESAVTGKPPDEAIYVANVIKYLWRYEEKEPLRSLMSAKWYLDRLIGKLANKSADDTGELRFNCPPIIGIAKGCTRSATPCPPVTEAPAEADFTGVPSCEGSTSTAGATIGEGGLTYPATGGASCEGMY